MLNIIVLKGYTCTMVLHIRVNW